MKTSKNILYSRLALLFVLITIVPAAFAQENSVSQPAFFHDINYYAAEYAKSKHVLENLSERNVQPVTFGLNTQFDMNDYLKEPRGPSFFSKALHFFKNKHQKEAEQVKEVEETVHSTAVHDSDLYDGAYDQGNSVN